MKNNKKRTGVLAGLLAGALLITGTLAWQDVSQHKTNKFTTTSVEHNVTLVETFEEVSNWRKGEGKVNEIAVRNGQDTDDTTSYIYEDAYVRVQLKEFMEIANKSYTYSEKRYMVDEKGNFKRFPTLELAQEFIATLGEEAPEDGRIEEVTGLFDKDEEGNAKGFFYIATQQADKNGQYGKFIVVAEALGEGDVLVEGSINQNHSSDDQHNNAVVDEETGSIDYNVDEDQYTTHLWGAGDNMSAEGNPFTQYVKWTFGEAVITMAEWDGQPTAQWIVDTDSTEGYAYWGEKLVHGTDATATPKSLTNNILEKVTLIEQPYGAAEYYIHVNMDAVNLKDVSLWDDAPERITKAYNGLDDISLARKALMNSIETAKSFDIEGIVTPAIQVLLEAIESAEVAHPSTTITLAELIAEKEALDEAIAAVKADALSNAKISLNKSLKSAKNADMKNRTTASKKVLYDAYLIAQPQLVDVDAALDTVLNSDVAVQNALQSLEYGEGLKIDDGRITGFADHNWTVVFHDYDLDQAIILSDQLSQSDMTSMGMTSDANGSVQYYSTASSVEYKNSNLIKIDKAFSEMFVSIDENVEYVQPVIFADEPKMSTGWNTRKDAPTRVDASGEVKAFSLSISDINYYGMKSNEVKGIRNYWLRTQTSGNSDNANIDLQGAISSSGYSNTSYGARPAVFVDVIDDALYQLP